MQSKSAQIIQLLRSQRHGKEVGLGEAETRNVCWQYNFPKGVVSKGFPIASGSSAKAVLAPESKQTFKNKDFSSTCRHNVITANKTCKSQFGQEKPR